MTEELLVCNYQIVIYLPLYRQGLLLDNGDRRAGVIYLPLYRQGLLLDNGDRRAIGL